MICHVHLALLSRCLKLVAVAGQVFELNRHLKQSGLANKENVPWDGGIADPTTAPALEVIRRLVHEIHVITHEAHKVEGEQAIISLLLKRSMRFTTMFDKSMLVLPFEVSSGCATYLFGSTACSSLVSNCATTFSLDQIPLTAMLPALECKQLGREATVMGTRTLPSC